MGGRRALVIGANGSIESAVIRRLPERGARVVGEASRPPSDRSSVRIELGDLSDLDRCRSLISDSPSVPDLNAFWRNVDQCSAPAVSTNGPLMTSTASCADGRSVQLLRPTRSVQLITVDGGGHQWPGSAPIRDGSDPPSQALNAASTFGQFFAGHAR